MDGLQTLHRLIAYISMILIFAAMLKAMFGMLNQKSFTEGDRKLGLFALISGHIQLLLGLALMFIGPVASQYSNMGEVMKNADLRFLVVEHPLTMIIGIVLITVGYSKSKKATTDRSKFKSMAFFYLLGLVLILSRIPWQKLA